MIYFSKIQRNTEVVKFTGIITVEHFDSIPFYCIMDFDGSLVFFEVWKDRKLATHTIDQIVGECLKFIEVQ
jgi:hypothetical protein